LLQRNFERQFYIPIRPEDDSEYSIDKQFVNKRGIYKDTVGSALGYTDYQFRPNFVVAAQVAPELFTPQRLLPALRKAFDVLLGPLGMRTLDPEDWNYRGDYDNANDSTDPLVAHGANYHQGPEWLWPVGYLLRALYQTAKSTTENVRLFINFKYVD
jgi:glycogen debranching enzyme